MAAITDKEIRGWIRSGDRFEQKGIGDGLYLRFRPSDAAPRWLFRYRFAGEQRIMHVGSFNDVSLADARKTAKALRALVSLGHDVAGEKQEQKREAVARIEAARSLLTVGKLADQYYEAQIAGRLKHPQIVRSRIERDIKPHLGKLAVQEVSPKHVTAMLDAIVARGAPTIANDVLRLTNRLFNYAIKRELAQSNPAAAFDQADAGGKEESRDRWLTREELAALFAAMRDAAGWTHENSQTVRLLLMLAVRKSELIGARVEELDLDAAVWHLPGERTKTGSAIDIPLPSQAVEIVQDLIRLAEGSAWLLPARKAQTRMLPHIDNNTINAAMAKCIRPKMTGEAFSPHDFRRTARTHLEALGVMPHVAERCLNHKVKGVQGIYNRHDYFAERKAALQAWADLLTDLEQHGTSKVVPIREKKAG